MANAYKEYRCRHCDKLLFKGILIDSAVEIKCKGCHNLSAFQGEAANAFICLVEHCADRVRAGS